MGVDLFLSTGECSIFNAAFAKVNKSNSGGVAVAECPILALFSGARMGEHGPQHATVKPSSRTASLVSGYGFSRAASDAR